MAVGHLQLNFACHRASALAARKLWTAVWRWRNSSWSCSSTTGCGPTWPVATRLADCLMECPSRPLQTWWLWYLKEFQSAVCLEFVFPYELICPKGVWATRREFYMENLMESIRLSLDAMNQAVIGQPFTAEAWSILSTSVCICGGQTDTGIGFSACTVLVPCQYHSTSTPYSFIYLSLKLLNPSSWQLYHVLYSCLKSESLFLDRPRI